MNNAIRLRIRRQNYNLSGLGRLGAAIDTIAQAIQKQEGYYPGSPAYRNNNPGNLIYTPYYAQNFGAVQGSPMKDKSGNVIGYFSLFPDYSTGLDALDHQITVDANRGLSIQTMMDKYAPALDAHGNPTGNNPQIYARNIANALGVEPGASLVDVLGGGTGAGAEAGAGASPLPGIQDYTAVDSVDSFGGGGGSAQAQVIDWGVLGLAAAGVLVAVLMAGGE